MGQIKILPRNITLVLQSARPYTLLFADCSA